MCWELHGSPTQLVAVDCTSVRELLSARLDDETTPAENGVVDNHMVGCAACRSWWTDAWQVSRVLRVRPAEHLPDLVDAVLARRCSTSPPRQLWVRYCLAIVALAEIVMAIPTVLVGTTGTSIDETPYIGSFGLAVAIGLLYIAWRPQRAAGVLPIVAALAATMAITATVHLAVGRTNSLGEAHHLLEVSGLLLVWYLAGRPLPRQLSPRHRPPLESPATLRPT